MTVWNAAFLGLVHGLAEFLPISASGHFSILSGLVGISDYMQNHLMFEAMLCLSSLIAVIVVYWQDCSNMTLETLGRLNLGPRAGEEKSRYPYTRLLLLILVSCVPLFFVLPIRRQIDALYSQSIFIGIFMILSGGLLFSADRIKTDGKSLSSMTFIDSVLIGACQFVAVIPGISRIGAAMSAGIVSGIRRDSAVRFAILISIPAYVGYTILRFADAFSAEVIWSCVPAYLIGMVTSLLSSIGAIYLLRLITRKGTYSALAYYSLVAGALSIILTLIF